MNQTNINAELLSGDTRRKHIPMAVFAVITIHVVLFVVLLIAAGCRAKARARLDAGPAAVTADATSTNTTPAPETLAENSISQGRTEPVLAREPEIERERVTPGSERTAQRALPARPRGDSSLVAATPATYTVKPGDTVGKIAKTLGVSIQSIREANQLKKDMIRPGQVLKISKSRQLVSI